MGTINIVEMGSFAMTTVFVGIIMWSISHTTEFKAFTHHVVAWLHDSPETISPLSLPDLCTVSFCVCDFHASLPTPDCLF